jgi:hypothetical protein
MNQEFLRQLTTAVPAEQREKLFCLLSGQGMEVYGKAAKDCADDAACVLLHAAEESTDGSFFISAADRKAAVRLLEEAGFAQFISEDRNVQADETDAVKSAEEEYFRRHRITMIECAVVLVAVVLYWLSRSFM